MSNVYGTLSKNGESIAIADENAYIDISITDMFGTRRGAIEALSAYCRKNNVDSFYLTCGYTGDYEVYYKRCDNCGVYMPLFRNYRDHDLVTCIDCLDVLDRDRFELHNIGPRGMQEDYPIDQPAPDDFEHYMRTEANISNKEVGKERMKFMNCQMEDDYDRFMTNDKY